MLWFFSLCFFISIDFLNASCAARSYGKEKFVCVCNASFCDHLEILSNVSKNHAALYETNKAGARFQATTVLFTKTVDPGIPILQVNRTKMYQFILGFGGAFTDAAGINIKSVPSQLQKLILLSYFSEEGAIAAASSQLENQEQTWCELAIAPEEGYILLHPSKYYNMGRIPIASCDFSTYPYSYDDVPGDFELKHFQLAKEDFLYKIPFIQKAISLTKEEFLLFGSPWSAPAWMKTNNAMNGQGGLIGKPGGKYYQTWADYFIKFLQEYEKNNITFWGITMQNEPTDGCTYEFPFQCMCFPPDKQRDFLKLHLGPTLEKAGFGINNLKLMILDDSRMMLPRWAKVILSDKAAAQYVSGIAFHWYGESFEPHKLLDITHKMFPNVFFLATEACTGSYPWEILKVDLGSWDRAERYAYDILQDLLNWSIGWIDWNLVLDIQGGPNWVKNFVDAPIIINATAGEFYKQPMYYALAQFSKILPRGSFRIGLEMPQNCNLGNLDIAAFQTPKNQIVVIAVNREDENINLVLQDTAKGYLNITVNAHGIQSYVW